MNIVQIVPTGAWSGSEKIAFGFANYLSENQQGKSYIALRTNSKFDYSFYQRKLHEKVGIIEIPSHLTGAKAIADFIYEYCRSEGNELDITHGHLGLGCRVAAEFSESIYRIGHMHIRFFTPQLKGLDAIVAVSEWQLKDVPTWYQGEVFLVPNFIEDLKALTENEIIQFRRRCYIKDNQFVYGVVSRLHLEKGVDLVIEAFKKLEHTDMKLVIIGDGAHSQKLRSLAKDDPRIVFTGFLSNASSYMRHFDCLVSPSRADSFGLSVLEGLFSGVPVISTATLGSIDIMGGDPLLCKMDDETDLYNKMLAAYGGVKNTCNYSSYTIGNSCKKMMDVYSLVLS